MTAALSLGIGYLIGCFSPAALVGRRKKVNLKQTGTGNLGATNTTLVLGRKAGVFVLLLDIFKSYFASKLARILFPHLAAAGLIAGIGTILGHSFNVFLRFQGGKGLAAFGGLILAYDPVFFVIIVLGGIALMFLTNHGVSAPIFGCVLFPLLVVFSGGWGADAFFAAVSALLVFALHWSNLMKALHHEDVISTKNFSRDILLRRRKGS